MDGLRRRNPRLLSHVIWYHGGATQDLGIERLRQGCKLTTLQVVGNGVCRGFFWTASGRDFSILGLSRAFQDATQSGRVVGGLGSSGSSFNLA
jgi:hypothetical protein